MASNRTFSATSWKPISPGPGRIEPTPTAIRADGAGTITAVGDDGEAGTFTVADGETLLIQPIRITAATATGLNALYN